MKYSIITTCKGRLHHLKQTLPAFVQQADAEVVVVDYDCPDKTADYVRANFPTVKVVQLADRPIFNLSKARNAGVEVATGEIFIFLDADILPASDFTEKAASLPAETYGEFIFTNDVRGSCVVPAAQFHLVGGYDEVILGYGAEDLDLYLRLRLAGLKRDVLSETLIEKVIRNTGRERVQFIDVGKKLGFARGVLYREAKSLLLRFELKCELDIKLRQAIWDRVDEIIHSPDVFENKLYLEIPLPEIKAGGLLQNCEFGRTLRMSVKLAK